jgi:hypothetical protein
MPESRDMRSDILGQLQCRRSLVWGALLFVLGTGLALFAPLFDSLGFEFSFAMGVPAALAAADLGAKLVRRGRAAGTIPPGPIAAARLWLIATAATVQLLLPPLAAIAVNAMRVRQCDWLFGLQCYLYLPCASVAFGSAAGVAVALAWASRPKTAAAAAWLVVLGSITLGVYRFYAAPPIFGYDPFAGYFPGTLYDEEIGFTSAFAWARLYHVCVAVAALAAAGAWHARRSGQPWPRRALAGFAPATVGAIVLYAYSGPLGFDVSARDMARALGGVRETPHFVIHYAHTPEIDGLIDAIAEEHELRWAQLDRRLGVHPRGKIHSFYFASAEQKQRWMGAKNVYIAKPWRHEIYVQHDGFPHSTLRHEIAHVFAGEFGDALFHVSVSWTSWPPGQFNVGLIEGTAVAADWPGGVGRLTPDQAVHAMQELQLLPPLRRLLATGFFEFSPQQSYTTAGSFVHFLMTRYGVAGVRSVYRAGGTPDSYRAAFGKSLGELEREWHDEIARAPIFAEDLALARERFRHRAIFSRPCPHAVAERVARAVRLTGRDPAAAVRLLRRVCSDDPDEPTHRLLLATALERAGELGGAADALRSVYDDDKLSSPLRARAMLAGADLAGRHGDARAAHDLAARALDELLPDADTRRNLRVRLVAYRDDSPGALALRAYLAAGVTPDEQEQRAASLPAALGALGEYLDGRFLWQAGRWQDAAAHLARAQALGIDDPYVARENDRILVVCAYLANDLPTARAAALRLAAPSEPVWLQLEGQDWLERIAFHGTGRLP